MNTEDRPIIIIGEAYDGFSLTVDDFYVWINQEDPPSKNLEKFFKYLGFTTEITEEY